MRLSPFITVPLLLICFCSYSQWALQSSGTDYRLNSVYIINNTTGFLGSNSYNLSIFIGGEILRTSNGGINWQQVLVDTNMRTSGFYFLNENTGFAGGGNSIIIKTTCGGFIGINPVSTEVPEEYSLSQNYPNPFNPTTNIKFSIPKAGFVKLAVYDMLGREVENLVSQQLTPGTYRVDWNAVNFSSGIYMYSLTTEDFSLVKKMSLIK
jgi:hypothetical protein